MQNLGHESSAGDQSSNGNFIVFLQAGKLVLNFLITKVEFLIFKFAKIHFIIIHAFYAGGDTCILEFIVGHFSCHPSTTTVDIQKNIIK